MHERRPTQCGDGWLGQAEHPSGVGGELRAATAVPDHVRRLEVNEVRRDLEGVVEILAVEHATGLGLERQHGVPRLRRREPIEPVPTMGDEQIGKLRIVCEVATVARSIDSMVGREDASDRLHVVAQVNHAHGERDRFTARMSRKAVAVPALEREAQRFANVGADVEPLHEHVGYFAARLEVVYRPLVSRLLEHPDDLVALLVRVPGRRSLRRRGPSKMGRSPDVSTYDAAYGR